MGQYIFQLLRSPLVTLIVIREAPVATENIIGYRIDERKITSHTIKANLPKIRGVINIVM